MTWCRSAIPARFSTAARLLSQHHLGRGWVGFDFAAAFGRPVKVVNDAAMQALGSYNGGKMLFLGLGTGLGSTMIVDGIVEPMELGHLPYKKGTYEDYVGVAALERYGKKKWRRHVADVVDALHRRARARRNRDRGRQRQEARCAAAAYSRRRQRQCLPWRISAVGGRERSPARRDSFETTDLNNQTGRRRWLHDRRYLARNRRTNTRHGGRSKITMRQCGAGTCATCSQMIRRAASG